MYKKLFVLMIVLALIVGGCSKKVERVAEIEGFSKYINSQYSIIFQYPSDWIYVDSTTTQEQLTEYCESFNMNSEDVRSNLQNSIVVFYSIDADHDDALRTMSLSQITDKDITLDSIKKVDKQQEISDMFNKVYRAEYPEYELMQDIKSREYGNNFFLTYVYKANLYDEPLAYFQAVTGDNNRRAFMFIYGIDQSIPDTDVSNFEKILSSYEFGVEVISNEKSS